MRRIARPGDLPRAWQQKWRDCSRAYIASRMYATRHEAEQAAFEDVRAAYWSEARKACDGDDAPGFDTRNGSPFADEDAGP